LVQEQLPVTTNDSLFVVEDPEASFVAESDCLTRRLQNIAHICKPQEENIFLALRLFFVSLISRVFEMRNDAGKSVCHLRLASKNFQKHFSVFVNAYLQGRP